MTTPRRLKAKPEALEARGLPVPSDHGAGDVARENAKRVLNAGLAVLRLKEATRLAEDAHIALRALVGDKHHATVAAAKACFEATKGMMLADDVLRNVMRSV